MGTVDIKTSAASSSSASVADVRYVMDGNHYVGKMAVLRLGNGCGDVAVISVRSGTTDEWMTDSYGGVDDDRDAAFEEAMKFAREVREGRYG